MDQTASDQTTPIQTTPDPSSDAIQSAPRSQLQNPLDQESKGILKQALTDDVIKDVILRSNRVQLTLKAASTNFIISSNYAVLTAAGACTIATIQGGKEGMTLVLEFTDGNITISDDATGTTDSVNLSSSFTSVANQILQLKHNGISWREVSRGIVTLGDYQAFTANGTWTKPNGLTGNEIVTVQLWGAGGGGGGVDGAVITKNGGGGGGAFNEFRFLASALTATVAVTIGAGGAGGVSSANGAVGGNSTFGAYLTAFGGGGGGGVPGGAGNGGGGGGGITSAGQTCPDGNGGNGGSPIKGAPEAGSATGGDSSFGGGGGGSGGAGGVATGAGGASAYGGGGGGMFKDNVTGGNGGASSFGGGGGGGGASTTSGAGGASQAGGSGGAAGLNSTGSAGTAPGGGGGGTYGGAIQNGGAGARGECRVWVTIT